MPMFFKGPHLQRYKLKYLQNKITKFGICFKIMGAEVTEWMYFRVLLILLHVLMNSNRPVFISNH